MDSYTHFLYKARMDSLVTNSLIQKLSIVWNISKCASIAALGVFLMKQIASLTTLSPCYIVT